MKNIRENSCSFVVSKTPLYKFPKAAEFGRALPKNKIYKHSRPNTKTKDLFIRQVERITWSFKLSPETINLPASKGVQEIQVLTITLKTGLLNHQVLQTIDKGIPSPILFILTYKEKSRYAAAYKRPSEADKNRWVISSYFETDWMPENTGSVELPVVLNLGILYRTLLQSIIPLAPRKNETLDDIVLRFDQLRFKERETARVEARLNKEKQFNRKVELNSELKRLKQDIEELKC